MGVRAPTDAACVLVPQAVLVMASYANKGMKAEYIWCDGQEGQLHKVSEALQL